MPTHPSLSAAQRQALQRHPGAPVHVIDPTTKVTYVLVRADLFDHMATGDDVDPREAYPFVDAAIRVDDGQDPSLADCQTPSRAAA